MRIIAGEAGGRRIIVPDGTAVRPTSDRVREAVFNSLYSAGLIADRVFADLFAGSGSLGLKALSRGAARVVFVERAGPARAAIEANLEALGFGDRAELLADDALDAAERMGPVDVALCDPPYDFTDWAELLGRIDAKAVVIESDRAIDVGADQRILKQRRYSGTVVTIAVGQGQPESE